MAFYSRQNATICSDRSNMSILRIHDGREQFAALAIRFVMVEVTDQ